MEINNVSNYIKENFEKLPKDVLLKLMNYLSAVDVLSLCKIKPEFMQECFRIKAFDQALAREAPLTKQSYDVVDQISLIDRGYKTLYNGRMDRNYEILVTDIKFGFPYDDNPMINVEKVIFSIKGLPPPRGTRVWLMGQQPEFTEMHTWAEDDVSVFGSSEQAIKFVRENKDSTRYGAVFIVKVIAYGRGLSMDQVLDQIYEASRTGQIIKYIEGSMRLSEDTATRKIREEYRGRGLYRDKILNRYLGAIRSGAKLIFNQVTLP